MSQWSVKQVLNKVLSGTTLRVTTAAAAGITVKRTEGTGALTGPLQVPSNWAVKARPRSVGVNLGASLTATVEIWFRSKTGASYDHLMDSFTGTFQYCHWDPDSDLILEAADDIEVVVTAASGTGYVTILGEELA